MKALYTKTTVVGKLWEQFSQYFSEQTNPTARHLFELVLSVLALNGYQSVCFNYEHFITEMSKSCLNSYYYALNESSIDLTDWMNALVKAALSIVPTEYSQQPIVLAIDDTLIEKSGKSFENCRRLFDHTNKNGTSYINGHCFVSLLMNVPVIVDKQKKYLPVPVAYRMWDKSQSKLELAAELVKNAMKLLKNRPVILCCDSWYPKGAVNRLVDEYNNLTLICNARIDTALYALPEPTGKRGRPRVRGEKLTLQNFELTEVSDTDYCVGARAVKTELFGHRTVYAVVTKTQQSDRYRLFLCSKTPAELNFDTDFLHDASASAYLKANPDFLPLAVYSLRWNIETAYYEQKTFWSLGCYMLESKTGIERLVNLLSLIYSAIKLLPFQSRDFFALMGLSPQESRFQLGKLIQRQMFLSAFDPHAQNGLNSFEASFLACFATAIPL